MTKFAEPAAIDCNRQAVVQADTGETGRACWYPQMGGYFGKAVAVVAQDGHVDVHVWHDGRFPFTGECHACSEPRSPVVVHLCDPDQFIEFGRFLTSLTTEGTQ